MYDIAQDSLGVSINDAGIVVWGDAAGGHRHCRIEVRFLLPFLSLPFDTNPASDRVHWAMPSVSRVNIRPAIVRLCEPFFPFLPLPFGSSSALFSSHSRINDKTALRAATGRRTN